MRAEPKNRLRSISTLARWAAGMPLAVAIGIFLGAQGPADSLESNKVTAPQVSSITLHASDKPTLPKAPVQVAEPAPAPIKYLPGLEEALVATGPLTDEENKDLDAALAAFHDAPAKTGPGGDYMDYGAPLVGFVSAHPQSNWNSALYLNIGLGYYHSGYFSRAFTAYEKAWQLGRNATNPQASRMVDRAVAELARMHARVGHAKELDALLTDIASRPIGGSAAEMIQGAKEGLWAFRHDPGVAYLCGPQALANLLTLLKATPKQIKIALNARSGPHGFSLAQLAKLADKTKLQYTLVHREPGQPIPVPSIINWKVNHYAAIVGSRNGVYAVQDATFGTNGGIPATAKAIDAEGSGYFLVPKPVMESNPKAGWRTVAANSAEARAVYGMGDITKVGPGQNSCNNTQTSSQGQSTDRSLAMTVANASTTAISLKLTDTPVGYAPQKGGAAFTKLTYNQREDLQPATFTFSNVSPNWSYSWQAYIQDDPTGPYYNVTRVAPCGGGYAYIYDNYANGFLAPELYDNSALQRVPSSGAVTSYIRYLPDGTKETYAKFDGATSYPRRVFLTTITDPQGNATTINYDSSLRVTSVVDAMGRSTTFTYGLSSYPLLITRVTDPFNRSTQLGYDSNQRLNSITDPIGITSSFTYSTSEPTFITGLTTPYGTSAFNDTPNPNDTPEPNYLTRSLTLTDPMGYTDYLYLYQNPAITPASDSASIVPTGMSTSGNGLLQWRNTYYWDRHAFALGATMTSGQVTAEDFTKATLTHWAHWVYNQSAIVDVKESVKPPLEHRTWLNHPDQPYGAQFSPSNGGSASTTASGRVLDDGTSQVSNATYTTNTANVNQLLTTTDPKGRTTQYNYATNNIDLLTVQQLTTSPSTYTTIATYGSYTTGHRPQTYTDAAGQVWHMAWNTAGQIHTVTDPNSNITTWNYDSSGRLSNIVNANSQTQVSYSYDSDDRVQTATDSEGYVLTYAYDNLDRVTSITHPDGTTDLYDYTFQSGPNAGNPSLELRKHTDRLGRVTTYAYDADRRLTSVTEPTQGSSTRTTSYDYYENGTLKDIIDANGNYTHWDIDIESRPIDKIYADGTSSAKTESYAYENTTSRLHSITDALGQVKTFTYAADDRLTGITYASSVNATPNVTFSWDTYFPRVTSMTDGTGTTNYSYTPIGTNGALKLSSIAGPYSNDTIGLTYDALSRISGRTISGGNDSFTYDSISRMNTHVTPLGTFNYSYQGQTDDRTTRGVINGSTTVSTNWGYDTNINDRRLISIANSGVTRSYTLGYGTAPVNVYDIMSITDTAATGHPWATQSHAYTYDNVDRLLTGSSTTPGNFAYGYDNLDNATTVTEPPAATVNPTYNVLNQLATFGTNTYLYDANGNTLSGDGVRTYKFDAENRLIEIDYVGTSNKTVFTYNGIGQRRVAAETVSGTTTTTRYLWCGAFICQIRDGSDNVLKREFGEGEYNLSTTQKLVYMPDQLNSVRDVLDAGTGNRVASYDYGPYGAVTRSNVTNGTDYQYSQLFYHPASGLYLSSTRALDGVTGRWINRDPIRENGGINLYGYAGANPTNRFDPSGLQISLPIDTPIIRPTGIGPGQTGTPPGLGPIIMNPNLPPTSLPAPFDPTGMTQTQVNDRLGGIRQQYHNRCDEQPPPQLKNDTSPEGVCNLLNWKIEREQDCIAMRQDYTDVYDTDPAYGQPASARQAHLGQIQQRERALDNLMEELKRNKCSCPGMV